MAFCLLSPSKKIWQENSPLPLCNSISVLESIRKVSIYPKARRMIKQLAHFQRAGANRRQLIVESGVGQGGRDTAWWSRACITLTEDLTLQRPG